MRRERSDGLYSSLTYLLAKMVEELLVILFVSLTVSACIFYAVGFHGEYILFWLVYLVTISIGMGESAMYQFRMPCTMYSSETG